MNTSPYSLFPGADAHSDGATISGAAFSGAVVLAVRVLGPREAV